MSSDVSTREQVPFRLRTADGDTVELTYSSPAPAPTTTRARSSRSSRGSSPASRSRTGCSTRPTSSTRSSRSGAARGRRGDRPAARGGRLAADGERDRDEYAREWQYYYSSSAGNADLGRLQAQFDEYYATLEANGVRVHYIEAPVPAIGPVRLPEEPRHARGRRARRARRRHRPPDGARLLAARPRGDLVEGADRPAGADLPHDPRARGRRARRRALARLEHVRLQRERGRERGGPPPDRLGARGARDRDDHDALARMGRLDRGWQHRHVPRRHVPDDPDDHVASSRRTSSTTASSAA